MLFQLKVQDISWRTKKQAQIHDFYVQVYTFMRKSTLHWV